MIIIIYIITSLDKAIFLALSFILRATKWTEKGIHYCQIHVHWNWNKCLFWYLSLVIMVCSTFRAFFKPATCLSVSLRVLSAACLRYIWCPSGIISQSSLCAGRSSLKWRSVFHVRQRRMLKQTMARIGSNQLNTGIGRGAHQTWRKMESGQRKNGMKLFSSLSSFLWIIWQV